MTNDELKWWLLGFCELCNKTLDKDMLVTMRNHFNLVMTMEHHLDAMNAALHAKVVGLLEEKEWKVKEAAVFQCQLSSDLQRWLKSLEILA